jgi:hypothetical protein
MGEDGHRQQPMTPWGPAARGCLWVGVVLALLIAAVAIARTR